MNRLLAFIKSREMIEDFRDDWLNALMLAFLMTIPTMVVVALLGMGLYFMPWLVVAGAIVFGLIFTFGFTQGRKS